MAKRNKKKQTPNQREYAKQVRRIKKAMSRAENRGYMFDKSIIAKTPERITQKLLKQLQELKGTKLYDKAVYIEQSTGEILSGLEGRKLERKASARKAKETRQRKQKASEPYYPDGGEIIFSNVVDSFISRLHEPTPEHFVNRWGKKSKKSEQAYEESQRSKSTLLSITYSVIADIGKSALGWRLEDKADDVNVLTNYVLYGSDASRIASACSELAIIINGGALSMQQLQDIAEQEEANEDWEEVE